MKRENDSGCALLLVARGGPSPGNEFVQAIVRPKVDEADENIGEIGLGLYAVQFASLCRARHKQVSISEARMAQFSAPSS